MKEELNKMKRISRHKSWYDLCINVLLYEIHEITIELNKTIGFYLRTLFLCRNDKSQLVNGTGFFIKLEANNNNTLFYLMRNEHAISQNVLNLNTLIKIKYDNQHKDFHLLLELIENNKKRFICNYRYLNIDAVVTEIFVDEDEKK